MKRREFIKKIRKLAKEKGLEVTIDKRKGKGSHYMAFVGDRRATIPKKLPPPLREAILKQLGLE